jgi:hypothetical protein
MSDKHLDNAIKYCVREQMYPTADMMRQERKRRQLQAFSDKQRPCPYCSTTMTLNLYHPDPEDHVGWAGRDFYHMDCPRCHSRGPRIETSTIFPS